MPLIDPEAAFYARLSTDATLKTALGLKTSGKADVVKGFPSDTLQKADVPRVTFFRPAGSQRASMGSFLIQSDIWVWNAKGSDTLMKTISDRMDELLNEVQWFYSGGRIWSTEAGSADYPSAPETSFRRRRMWRLTVS